MSKDIIDSKTRGEREVREAYSVGSWVSPLGVEFKVYRSGWWSQDKFEDFLMHRSFVKYVEMLYPDYEDDD